MKKEEVQPSKPSLFVGICKTCGEIYEARSALEDLEGVTFECKKMMCEGRVSLVSSGEPLPKIDLDETTPKRFH